MNTLGLNSGLFRFAFFPASIILLISVGRRLWAISAIDAELFVNFSSTGAKSEGSRSLSTSNLTLNARVKWSSSKYSTLLVVPTITILLVGSGGIFFTKTRIAYKMGFENRGPMFTNSISLSMSSRTTILRGVLYALSKTFDMSCIFPFSVYPTYSSGVIIFANGKPLSIAKLAAMAVFPAP